MKKSYISPELNIFCFAPVERLASEDPFAIRLSVELETGGDGGSGVSGESDEDFGLEIL